MEICLPVADRSLETETITHSKSTQEGEKRTLPIQAKTRSESAKVKEMKTGKSAVREEFGRKQGIRF